MTGADIYSLLTQIVTGQALVYPVEIPEKTALPAISYSIIACTQEQTLDNHANQKYRVECNCWGASYLTASTLRDTLITSLNGYLYGNTSVELVNIQDFFQPQAQQFRAMAEFYFYASGFGTDAFTYVPPTEAGIPQTFVFTQNAPSATWVIVHNLNKEPVSVTVQDSAGSWIIGSVQYDNLNQLTISFSAAFSGSAYLV